MQSLRKTVIQFYKPVMLWNVLFSIGAIYFLIVNGPDYTLGSFFIKALGYAATVGYQRYYSPKSYLQYRNTGYTIRKLYSYTFALDFAIFGSLFIVIITVLTTIAVL